MDKDKNNVINGQDMGLRYGGRVLKFEIFVNTDADHRKIAKALSSRARGPRQDAVAMVVEVYDGDSGKEIWEALKDISRSDKATPGFPDEEDKNGVER
jgi:hypothetical protein